jgi:hypothetical protein
MLEPASPVGPPALGEIVESDGRSTFGRAADEVAPEGDAVSVDDDLAADARDRSQMQRRPGAGGAVPGALVALVVPAVQPDAARAALDAFGQTAGDRLEHLVEVAGDREKARGRAQQLDQMITHVGGSGHARVWEREHSKS